MWAALPGGCVCTSRDAKRAEWPLTMLAGVGAASAAAAGSSHSAVMLSDSHWMLQHPPNGWLIGHVLLIAQFFQVKDAYHVHKVHVSHPAP